MIIGGYFFYQFSIKKKNNIHVFCGYSLESPRRGGDSNDYPQHIFLWRNKQNYPSIITKYPPYLFHCLALEVRSCVDETVYN